MVAVILTFLILLGFVCAIVALLRRNKEWKQTRTVCIIGIVAGIATIVVGICSGMQDIVAVAMLSVLNSIALGCNLFVLMRGIIYLLL